MLCKDGSKAGGVDEGTDGEGLIGNGKEIGFYLSVIPTQCEGEGFGEVTSPD